jgi:vancomycin resistance protein YoaR
MSRTDRRNTAIRFVVSLLVLVGAYVGLCVWASEHVPASAMVGDIRIGGMTSEEARAAVEKGAAGMLSTPIVVSVPGQSGTFPVEPGKVGFAVDVERSLEGLAGFTLNPVTVWEKLTGDVQAPLVTKVDDDALTAFLDKTATIMAAPATEGGVSFPDGKVSVTLPQPGQTLDIAGTKLALRRAFPGTTTATAAVHPVEPEITAEQYQQVADDFGQRAMSGPVEIVADGATTKLNPSEFAPVISVVKDGTAGLTPRFDEEKLTEILADKVKVKTNKAKDARWTFEPGNGRPKLIPSVDGTAVDEKALTKHVIDAITSDERKVTVKTTVTKPKFTTEDAKAAGVKELVVDFRSPFPPGDPTRTNNLVVAARTINGTYLAPGDTFSLNGVLGERTKAKGYGDGTVIINGRLTRGTGGGISQVSTTIYNMAYFAGADIIEATPHAFFIPRYPEGREATVYWPTVDNKWRNDTDHGMLLQTWVDGGYVHGRVWSTKTWDVKSIKGPRRNVVPPKTIRNDSLKCYPQEANPGFDVTVTRQWYRPGSSTLVKSEAFHTHYIPEDRIICTNPKARP